MVRSTPSTKCSKKSGEYCRLHNPAPQPSPFNTINDVFARIDKEETSRTKPYSAGASFQNITATRTLPVGVPLSIKDHIDQNAKELAHLTEEQRIALSGYAGFGAGVCNSVLLGNKYEYYNDAPLWRESGGPCDFYDREDLVDYMETMDDILSSRQAESRIVYRGIPIYNSLHDEIGASVGKKLTITDTEGLTEGLKEYYKPGKVFNYSTYLSTTQSSYYAASRTKNTMGTKEDYSHGKAEVTGIVFELKTNAGLDIVSAVRKPYSDEREIVLPRDTHFKVVNVHVKPEKYDTISGEDTLWEPGETKQETYTKLAVVVQMVEVDKNGKEITSTTPHKPSTTVDSVVPKD